MLADTGSPKFDGTVSYVAIGLVGNAVSQSLHDVVLHVLECFLNEVSLVEAYHLLERVERVGRVETHFVFLHLR